jgi:imidazolonepropionase-like amidohydrolase
VEVLLSGALVFDGEQFLDHDASVLIKGQQIAAVGAPGQFEGFAGERLEVTNCTLMPGLIDCHVHLCLGGEPDTVSVVQGLSPADATLKILENAQAALRGGVTTVRDLGGKDFLEMGVKKAIVEGRQLGPRIQVAGKVICITGGHGSWLGIEADGVSAVRKAVRTNVKAGADWIKFAVTGGVITPGVDPLATHFTQEELFAGIETARMLGRRTACHAQGAHGIGRAVEGGIDSVEHGFEITDEVAELMIDRGVYLVATLAAPRCIIHSDLALPAHVTEKVGRFAEMHRESFRRFVRAGGKIAMGTDAGTPGNFHGDNCQELQLMVENGCTTVQVLNAATGAAAELLGIGDTGRVRAGYCADLLLVDGDAREDISKVADRSKHKFVVRAGSLTALSSQKEANPPSQRFP